MSALLRPGACLLALLLPLSIAAGPDPDTVRVWCFGGRIGAASGHTITRDGALMKYEKPFGSAAVSTLLRRGPASADSVFAALERIRFRSLHYEGRGNMTCALELNDDAGKHTVTWLIGQPPAELEPVLAALGRAFGDDRRMWP